MSVVAFIAIAEARAPLSPRGAAKVAQSEQFNGETALMNINNMSMWFRSDGWSGRDPLTGNSGVSFPRGTDYTIFADGLIFGGYVRDGVEPALRVGGQTYEIGTVPGRIVSKGVADDTGARIYRVRMDWATGDLRQDAAEMLVKGISDVTDADVADLRTQYEYDWMNWPAAWGAPYYDMDGNGSYDPNVDQPSFRNANCVETPDVCANNADQIAWFVINDLDAGATTSLYGAPPIGLEIQVTMWAYARTDALGDVIFKKFRFSYEGTETTPDDAVIEDMYVAQWSDPDLGDYGDDFAGSDVGLSLGYVYNGQDDDSHFTSFGLAPPASGYDFLQGPIVPVTVEVTDDDGNVTQEPDPNAHAIFDFNTISGYKNLPMTSFVYFAAGSSISDPSLGEYDGTLEWYNLLQGYQPQPDVDNPVPYTNPITGEDTKFTLDGDPTRATGWNDGVPLPPGDRRIVLNTGPFTMKLGDVQEVVVALIGGLGSDRFRSISKLKFNDLFVQDAYNSFFQVPPPPTAPQVRAAQLDKAIVLDWGFDANAVAATEQGVNGTLEFEGYNVYQLPSAEATLDQGVKLGSFDLENGVTTILGIDLDDASGVILDVPLQIGTDFGVRRNLKITQDAVRGGPLVNGQRYYFAVTAYSHNKDENAATTTLESPPQIMSVVPQQPAPGVRYGTTADAMIDADHPKGASDGTVSVHVVDPTRTTGDSYELTYADDGEGGVQWTLRNKTDGKNLLTNVDQSGQAFYVGAEGFEVMVSGPPNGMKDWGAPGVTYPAWKAENGGSVADFVAATSHSSASRWWTWAEANWGAEGFSGAMTGDINHQWFEPTTVSPADLRTVEVRFTSVNEEDGEDQYKPIDPNNENVSMAYRYLRGAGADVPALDAMTTTSNPYDWSKYIVNNAGPGIYVYQDRVPIALSAWDIESDPPRRLSVGFLENNQPGGLVNGAYGPAWYGTASNIAGGGPREWLFIFDDNYDANGNNPLLTDHGLLSVNDGGPPLPVMYIVFANRRIADRFPQDGDTFYLAANHVNTADDVFSFTVPGTTSDDALLKADLEKVNVFPNPYYGLNSMETSRYEHFVTFSHLPQKATIRIFDVAGNMVRTLEKDNADQFFTWNLSNDNNLPVASGLYIAHVDMPDAGMKKVLKLAIVQEQQFLESY
jgi:hypothetical protein